MIAKECFKIYSKVLMYSSHYMYLDFVTIYIQCAYFLYKMMMYVFHYLSHMCCFFSFFIQMFLCLYNLSIFYTRCLDGSCLVFQLKWVASLSYCDLSSCKVFQELIVLVILM